ncbi:zinc-ribbon domain-containing protein [Nocardioides taihuensis]|uniref:Zinc-ribbon domain-containing protein n=1 Tax=Nocardioides taihuensis TaxID=1835606 RepID=A0ABW0BIK3_9ACTN
MDSTPDTHRQGSAGPGLRDQGAARTVFRVLGCLLTPLGAVLVAVGFYRFVTVDPGFDGPPAGFLVFAAGGFMTVVGFGFLNAGFLGTAARYSAGETMPVVKDSASYLSDGEGILGMGRTVDDGRPAPTAGSTAAAGPYCRSCGTRNDPEARFCDGCGHSLA